MFKCTCMLNVEDFISFIFLLKQSSSLECGDEVQWLEILNLPEQTSTFWRPVNVSRASVVTSLLQSCSSVTQHWLFTDLMKEGFLSPREAAPCREDYTPPIVINIQAVFHSLFVLCSPVIISNHFKKKNKKKPSLSCWVDLTGSDSTVCKLCRFDWQARSVAPCSVSVLLDAMLCCVRFHHEYLCFFSVTPWRNMSHPTIQTHFNG